MEATIDLSTITPGQLYRIHYALRSSADGETILATIIAIYGNASRIEIVTRTGKRRLLQARGIRSIEEPGSARRTREQPTWHAEALEAWVADPLITLQEIADRHGVTRERVRQIIRQHDPHKTIQLERQAEARVIRQGSRAAAREARAAAIKAELPACIIPRCDEKVSQRNAKTCGPIHAEAYRLNAYRIDEDAHRLQLARGILRHPEGKRPAQIAWARRILTAHATGQPLPPKNRTYTIPGSRASQMWNDINR